MRDGAPGGDESRVTKGTDNTGTGSTAGAACTAMRVLDAPSATISAMPAPSLCPHVRGIGVATASPSVAAVS